MDGDGEGEFTDRSVSETRKTLKNGKVVVRRIPYRYQKRFYGCAVNVSLTCGCEEEEGKAGESGGGKIGADGSWQNEVGAGSMEEMN